MKGMSNIEQGMKKVEGRGERVCCVFKRTNSMNRSWISCSPVAFSFIIRHSLFDIRYSVPDHSTSCSAAGKPRRDSPPEHRTLNP
jgi:hypothetical protein